MTGELQNQAAEVGETDAFRAGYLAGWSDRQAEIEHLESVADILYRAAHGEDRRSQTFTLLTRAELERRRTRPRPEPVTREQALASWGITETRTISESDPAVDSEVGPSTSTTARPSRRRTAMSVRTIIGNLAVDPEVVQAGRVQIVKLRVIENTGEYRQGEWVKHDDATTHFVEAKFELGHNTLASLHKGDAVIVVGSEHTVSWGEGEAKRYGRVVDADHIGPDLTRATAQVTRIPRGTNGA